MTYRVPETPDHDVPLGSAVIKEAQEAFERLSALIEQYPNDETIRQLIEGTVASVEEQRASKLPRRFDHFLSQRRR